MEAGAARPVAQRRPIKPDALARINLGLTIKRRVVAELGDDHVRDGRFGRQPAGHDVFRCVRLCDRARAAATDVFRAACDQHAPLRRDHVDPTSSPIFVMAPQPHGQSVLAGSMIRSTRGKWAGKQPRLR
ncbi:hypothetical protein ACVI1I_006387 [Bradyrhizobium sp. USDA 4459]